jgi:surface carbohydrate biosynthesis protein (TIGR04326 family)
MVTSMYPSPGEFGIRPLPDRVVTNGPLSCRVLRREGWPPNRVAAGCGLRHTYLWDEKGEVAPASTTDPGLLRILVATAIGLGDSVELIAKAAEAFGGVPGYQLVLKCHPLVSIPEVRGILGKRLDHANIRFSQEPLDRLLPASDLLLYTFTTVCFEALRYGVAPVFVLSENFVNMDKLDGVPQLRHAAADAEDLRRIAEGLRGEGPAGRAAREAGGLVAVRDALAPVTGGCADLFLGKGSPGCGDGEGTPAGAEKPSSGAARDILD